jgi:hypothetical protein
MSQFGQIIDDQLAGNHPVFKSSARISWANWPYPKDAETTSIRRVKGFERATSPSGTLFLAYFRGFSAILILFMSL